MSISFLPARARGRRATAVALLIALGAALFGAGTPAVAATPGLTLTVDVGGQTYDGSTVIEPGQSYSARLQYSVRELTPGQQATIAVPDGITVPAGSLVVPAGNTIVESLHLDADGDLVVTFKDPLDRTIDQGVLRLDFTFDAPEEGTAQREFTWSVDGEPTIVTVVVREPGDQFRPDLGHSAAKSRGGVNLSQYVTRSADGSVAVAPAIAQQAIDYTVTLNATEARPGVTLIDTIDDYLAIDADSLTATLTTWDEDGFNRTVEPFTLPAASVDGSTTTVAGIDIPAQSILTVTYSAHVRADRIADLRDALQERADAVSPVSGGNFAIAMSNAVEIDGFSRSASVTAGGSVPAEPTPSLNTAFRKSVSPSGPVMIGTGDDDILIDPVAVTYTLRADLTQFAAFTESRHALAQNVVITDTLPGDLVWDDEPFISATGMTLAPASDACTTGTEMSEDVCVGQYTVSADGKTLTVNVGSDVTTSATITARATIDSVHGLPVTHNPNGQPQIAAQYTARNTASFDYRDGSPATRNATTTLRVPQAPGSVIDDPSQFTKTSGGDIVVRPGERALVDYTFVVAEGAVEDLSQVRIVDHIDESVFDLSDLDTIRDSISGTYAWAAGLSGSDFVLSVVDGSLVITTSDSFGDGLPSWARQEPPLTRRLAVELSLPTMPLVGKQTLAVTNTASVEGDGIEDYVWYSESRGEATTYGDELEVSKVVYGGDGQWTQNLRVPLDSDGLMAEDTFVYRIELIPHGDYSGVSIIPLADVLPTGTSFVGFVADAAVDSGDVLSSSTVAMGGNVEATWIPDDRTVAIEQRAGTTLPRGATVAVNFMVQVDDFSENVGITNSVGGTSATITPSDGFPIMVLKRDSERPQVSITDRDARFTVTAPGGDVVTDAAYVVDGRLVVEGPDGDDSAIVIPANPQAPGEVPAGTYTVAETTAPAGYARASQSVSVVLGEDGASDAVTLFNDPLPLLAIGDLVWVDSDGDGVQGENEPPLKGVAVELLDADTGAVMATTVTGEDGRYLFDLLEAGDYRVRFTLTPEQAATYTLTTADAGDDDAVDSDADRATGETGVITLSSDSSAVVAAADYPHGEVHALLGVDPTWDAGVVLRPGEVSVGDVVWLDENRDGRQDDGEPGIPGVVLTLEGPDGQPVVDVDGRTVVPQTTDDEGRYLFTGLPVLDEGESYRVLIDRDASNLVLAPFEPTLAQQGDRGGDSSLWEASSEGLTVADESDLTLDFGFVRVVVPEPEVTTPPSPEPTPGVSTPPTESPSSDDGVSPDGGDESGVDSQGGFLGEGLASSGPQAWLLAAALLALLLAGAGAVTVRARRR